MMYRLPGYPEIDEIVLCQVTKIFPNSVFVDLLEYEGKSGIVHISEVSPGRIRNLRDFVSLGRQIVCKVLRIDRERGHIDLSLRRVNSTQRGEKLEQIKQELKAESLVKNLSTKLKTPFEKLYDQISKLILKEYSYLYPCFKEVAAGEITLAKLGFDKQLAAELEVAIIEKFRPKKVLIAGEIKVQSYAPQGVEQIKKLFSTLEKISETIKLSYLGGGRYKVMIEDFDYKSGEKTMKKIEEILSKFNDKFSVGVLERGKNE